ncbi:hypothetical protein [Pseudomonas putida]|uniref:Uncharacterized protein n=1 Tax=Pseudomonas putida TaxID=303 RepID=A0A8I1ECE0_PSEPU|nr:hypothetical protein [Pseudomonas putida]MBI6882703.1 hypothetical protein [Pseudomonas putida]
MSKIENWLNRHYMSMFAKELTSRHPSFQADLKESLGYFAELDQLMLDDGKLLDTSGPAFMQILRFLDVTGNRTTETLDDLREGLHKVLLPAWERPISSGAQDLLNTFFEMRAEGEWGEWDRLVTHLLGVTMGDFVDEHAAVIRYAEDDVGAGGDRMYSVGYGHPSISSTVVAFGSTPAHALSFLPDVVSIAGDSLLKIDMMKGGELWFRRNRSIIFEMPLQGVWKSANGIDESILESAYTMKSSPQWGLIDWRVQDEAVMKALASIAPDDAKPKIKGGFLKNDLGI